MEKVRNSRKVEDLFPLRCIITDLGQPKFITMKSNQETNSDERLRALLKTWTVEATPAPRFQEHVWQRIARSSRPEPSGFEILFSWLENITRQPALAFAYLAILLVIGLGAGFVQAQKVQAQARSQFEAMYVQSVDPYQRQHP